MTEKNHSTGFTLVEIIITLTVSIVIFILITSVYGLSQKSYSQTDTKAEITQNGRVILDRMIREIRQTPDIITELPANSNDPDLLPSEIMFQDGHDISQIRYIRYFLESSSSSIPVIKRQIIIYYFPIEPDYYVHIYDTDKEEPHGPPTSQILEEKVIGEYIDDIEFWGTNLLNINLYLSKNNQSVIINTAVYGRNL